MVYVTVAHHYHGILLNMSVKPENLETATRTLAHILDFWAKDILSTGIPPEIKFELR